MDLSQVPTEVLQAEHDAVDELTSPIDYQDAYTPICALICGCHEDCPINVECSGLIDEAPGWSERKERYLLAIRAEIAERSRLSQLRAEVVC